VGGRRMRNSRRTQRSEEEEEEVLQVLGQRFPCSLLKRPCQRRYPPCSCGVPHSAALDIPRGNRSPQTADTRAGSSRRTAARGRTHTGIGRNEWQRGTVMD